MQIIINEIKSRSFSIAFVLMIIILTSSCSRKIPFLISAVVPSAEGSVQIKSDKNTNYTIDLSVLHLVDPARLTPPKMGYIVWMETESNGVKNIGQLKTSHGSISQTFKSSLTTMTPFKPISFFITSEDNLTTQYPGSVVVLKTDIFSVE